MANLKIKLRKGLFPLHKLSSVERGLFISVSNAVRSHPAVVSMNRALLRNVRKRLISMTVADDCVRGVIYDAFAALAKDSVKIIKARGRMPPAEFKNFVSGLVNKVMQAEYTHIAAKLKGKNLLVIIKDINRNPKINVIVNKNQ